MSTEALGRNTDMRHTHWVDASTRTSSDHAGAPVSWRHRVPSLPSTYIPAHRCEQTRETAELHFFFSSWHSSFTLPPCHTRIKQTRQREDETTPLPQTWVWLSTAIWVMFSSSFFFSFQFLCCFFFFFPGKTKSLPWGGAFWSFSCTQTTTFRNKTRGTVRKGTHTAHSV